MQDRYSFREWSREVMLWSLREEMTAQRKAAWLASSLENGTRELVNTMPAQAMIHGGQINGVQVDPMAFILHSLAERYAPLGEETRMRAARDLLEFAPDHAKESMIC